jgi:hypothetical protein
MLAKCLRSTESLLGALLVVSVAFVQTMSDLLLAQKEVCDDDEQERKAGENKQI